MAETGQPGGGGQGGAERVDLQVVPGEGSYSGTAQGQCSLEVAQHSR